MANELQDSHSDVNTSQALVSEMKSGRLLSDSRYQYLLDDYIFDYAGNDNLTGLPKNGIRSLLYRRIPVFVYDHPALTEMCDTAFATESLVAFHVDFLVQLLEERKLGLASHRLRGFLAMRLNTS